MKRFAVAIAIGLLAALLCSTFHVLSGDPSAGDLQWPLEGARLFLRGIDPYGPAFNAAASPFYRTHPDPLFYPFPALLLFVPLVMLPNNVVAICFVGISAALVAFLLYPDRLLVCASAPFVFACAGGQWGPLLTLVALSSVAAPLALCKPNVGLALFLYKPTWTGALLCASVGFLSILIFPAWPWEWLANVRGAPSQYQTPILLCPLPALALLRWRKPEARLLFALALFPQVLWFYDQVPLALIPQTMRTRLIFAVSSWLGLIAVAWAGTAWHAPLVLAFLYAPALLICLTDKRTQDDRKRLDVINRQLQRGGRLRRRWVRERLVGR